MNIAILGGSFDPPHLGHYLIAEQVKEFLHMDQVWLMPLYQKNLQNKIFHKQLTAADQRFTMATFLETETIKVSDFELKHNQTSYSLTTLQELKQLYPEHTFHWILGSDQLEGFQKYYKWQELVQTQKLIIFPREHMLWHLEERVKESLQSQTIPENVIVLQRKDLILTNISSTLVRERVSEGSAIRYLVTEKVEEYIKKKELYKK